MSMFVCESCGCVDDSSLSPGASGWGGICTECSTGTWHHLWDKVEYDPVIHTDVTNRTNPQTDEGSEVSLG